MKDTVSSGATAAGRGGRGPRRMLRGDREKRYLLNMRGDEGRRREGEERGGRALTSDK